MNKENSDIINRFLLTGDKFMHKFLSWKSAGISNEKLGPPKNENSPKVLFEKTKPYLKINSFKFLAQKKL